MFWKGTQVKKMVWGWSASGTNRRCEETPENDWEGFVRTNKIVMTGKF